MKNVRRKSFAEFDDFEYFCPTNFSYVRELRRRTFMGEMTLSYSSIGRRVANGFMCEITKGKTIIALTEAAK
jgi:hypothetical protein